MKRALCLALVVACASALVAAGKPATVRLKQEGLTLEMTFDNKSKLTLTAKPVPLAEGQYSLKAMRLIKPDDKKRAWEMQAMQDFGTIKMLTVEAGQDKVIDTGEPITYDCFVWVTGKTTGAMKDVLLRITTYGLYSEMYYPGAVLGGRRPPPPAWKVTAADGRVFGQGQFAAPAANGVVQATFQAPKDYVGKVKVELVPTMGPFEWKYRGQEASLKQG